MVDWFLFLVSLVVDYFLVSLVVDHFFILVSFVVDQFFDQSSLGKFSSWSVLFLVSLVVD